MEDDVISTVCQALPRPTAYIAARLLAAPQGRTLVPVAAQLELTLPLSALT